MLLKSINQSNTIKISTNLRSQVTVNKQGMQIIVSEFESHWVPYNFGLVPNLSKLSKKKKKKK